MTLNEALLQRDIAASERDELRKQLSELEDAVKEIKAAELEVFNRVEAIAAREVNKIKSAFSQINVPLKKRGLYFNPLANSKRRIRSAARLFRFRLPNCRIRTLTIKSPAFLKPRMTWNIIVKLPNTFLSANRCGAIG